MNNKLHQQKRKNKKKIVHNEQTIWRKPRTKGKRTVKNPTIQIRSGFSDYNEIKNRIFNANHPYRVKEIKYRCNQLEHLIPPSLQKKMLFEHMEPATSFLEATMDLPLEEDSKLALNCLHDEVNDGMLSIGETSLNQNPSITDATQFAISENLENYEDYNRSKLSADETTALPPAPKPPIILNPTDLYDIVNLQNEERLPWEKVTRLNKSNYYRAIAMLKKDYIRKYKSYLHSLSSEQLHKHKVETVFHEMFN